MAALGALALPASALVAGRLTPWDGSMLWALRAYLAFCGVGSAAALLGVFSRQVRATDSGISSFSVISGSRRLAWAELSSITLDADGSSLRFQGPGTRSLRVSRQLSPICRLLDALERRRPDLAGLSRVRVQLALLDGDDPGQRPLEAGADSGALGEAQTPRDALPTDPTQLDRHDREEAAEISTQSPGDLEAERPTEATEQVSAGLMSPELLPPLPLTAHARALVRAPRLSDLTPPEATPAFTPPPSRGL